MKTTLITLALCLFIQAFAFSQNTWSQVNDPAFWRGSPVELINANNQVFANVGLAIYRFNTSEQVWEYAGANLIDNNPYQYFENYFVWENTLYVKTHDGLMRYNQETNAWNQQAYALPDDLPAGYNIFQLGATSNFVYAIVNFSEQSQNYSQLYISVDFETWNPGLVIDDFGLQYWRISFNNDYIAWASEDNYVLLSTDGIDADTLEFGTVPLREGPDEWAEFMVGEKTGDYVFYRAPDTKLYRYSISEDCWDTISNNFSVPTNMIDMTADDGLMVITAIGGTGLVVIGSNDGGESYFPMTGQFGPLPFISGMCRQSGTNYWFTTMTSDILFSQNSGAQVGFKNENFNAGLNYVVGFDNMIFSFIPGYGVSKASPDNMIFATDNNGTTPFLGMLASDNMMATGSRLYYSLIEDITNGAMGLYYKNNQEDAWAKVNVLNNLVGLRFLGYDASGNLYIIATQTQGKASVDNFYRVTPELTLIEMNANFPGFADGTAYQIVGGESGELYFFFVDNSSVAKIYRSDNLGQNWTDLNLNSNFANYTFVENLKKLGQQSEALVAFDDDGNLTVFMRTIFGLPLNYENIIVKYNPGEGSFSLINGTGLTQEMLYAASLGYFTMQEQHALLFTPFGIFSSLMSLDNWYSNFDSGEGFRPGMVPNAALLFENKAVVSTLCHGIWTTDYSLSNETISTNDLTIYPNPARNYVYVRGTSEGEAYTITDISGKTIMSGYFTDSETRISFDKLIPGLYCLVTAGGRNVVISIAE
ncbi:MAG TPA: T9SS type A sorting domain-containing protein [Bacteroidales bacterium]|nr:T9SS type A sorting domain-containing protein [Bacteroidales bacterium]